MPTRSYIAIRYSEDDIQYIYCHYDGYPSHNGRLLLDHWSDQDRVHNLISQGSLRNLDTDLTSCEFYLNQGLAGSPEIGHGYPAPEEYIYIFDVPTSKWLYSDHGAPLTELTKEVCELD